MQAQIKSVFAVLTNVQHMTLRHIINLSAYAVSVQYPTDVVISISLMPAGYSIPTPEAAQTDLYKLLFSVISMPSLKFCSVSGTYH